MKSGTSRRVRDLSRRMRGTMSILAMFASTIEATIFMSKHRVSQEAFSTKLGCSITTSGREEQSPACRSWTVRCRPSVPRCQFLVSPEIPLWPRERAYPKWIPARPAGALLQKPHLSFPTRLECLAKDPLCNRVSAHADRPKLINLQSTELHNEGL